MSINKIKGERSSNSVIMLLLAANAALTGVFAWNHLGGVFGELTGDPVGDILVRVLAVVLTVAAFDGAFHSWASISKRDNLSLEQITTAGTAKSVAMGGSVVASFAQVILGQNKIIFPADLLFFIAIVALIAVAVVLILHVIWWDKFTDESFEAVKRKFEATQSAESQKNIQKQAEDKAEATASFEMKKQALALERQRKEQELELQIMREEDELASTIALDNLAHKKAIAAQTRKNLARNVYESASEIARIQGQEATRNFRAENGLSSPPAPFDSPRVQTQTMAADGVQAGSVIHRVVKDANGNVISEEELPDLYAPVTGNGTAPN